jgi:predicted nucleotidyltransferase
MSVVDLLAPPDEQAVAKAVDAYAAALRKRYGSRLKGVYLFGSRARGDFGPYSDVDVAFVVADGEPDSFEETKVLSDLAYDLLLETGAEIQPWMVAEREWQEPSQSQSPALVRAMKRDGRPVWVAS